MGQKRVDLNRIGSFKSNAERREAYLREIETVIDEQYELTMSSILTAVNLGASFKTKILIY